MRFLAIPMVGALLAGIAFGASPFAFAAAATKTPADKPPVKKPAPKPKPGLDRAARAAMSAITPTSVQGRFLLVDLSEEANANFTPAIGKGPLSVGGVPFRLPQGEKDCLALRQAQWNGWQQDFPWSHESPTPARPHDPTMPILRVPVADYVAAHVLAVAEDDPGLAPAFTLRMGTVPHGGNEQCVQYDFAGQVPRRSEVGKAPGKSLVRTSGQPLC